MTVYRSLVLCTENKHVPVPHRCHCFSFTAVDWQFMQCELYAKITAIAKSRPMAKITINKAPTISCFSYIAKRVGSEERQQKVK